jgi:predicted GNAT family N-acyltransferase
LESRLEIRPPIDLSERDKAIALRYDVFITEEGRTRTVETDEVDDTCQHFVAVLDGEVIGTLRLYLLEPGDADIKIGRVAVKKEHRGNGVGKKLMQAAYCWAFPKFPSIYLWAQVGVAEFYDKLGYVKEGEIFTESGAPHITMRLMRDS